MTRTPEQAQKKVLVVEDEAIVAYDLARRLRKAGYDVPAIASSGLQALESIEETAPDLILLDIRLQGDMDGIAVATEVRERFKLPVVYLTANADHATLERAKATGPFGYLVKPIGNVNLASAIEVALYKHRAERELEDREAWLSTVLHAVADAMVVTDAWGRIQFLNPAAEEMTGWPCAEVVGKPFGDVFCLLDAGGRGMTGDLLSAAMLEGVATELPRDLRLISRQGRTLQIEGGIAVSQAKRRAAVGMVMTFRDVTARKLPEVEARRERQMLAAGELAGGIAKDFDELLANVQENTAELLREVDGDHAFWGRLKTTEQAVLAARLQELYRNQLVEPQNLDLNAVIVKFLPALERLTGPSMQVETNLDRRLGGIWADPRQIGLILLNLVLNARDGMPEGGRVSISTENVDLPRRSEMETGAEAFVRLAVRDNGTGVKSESDERRFDPFPTGRSPRRGSGLGLAIAHAIVSAGDGLINVDSRPGAGSLFEIFVPRVESGVETEPFASATNAALESEPAAAPGDPGAVEKMFHEFVERDGFEVLERMKDILS
jgi:two-component system cell cycle sensor histidine kinase/response regulator CckA